MNYPNNNYNFYPNNFNNMNSPYMNYNNQQGIMNQMGLNGRIVDSEEMGRGTEVPIGGYGVFPKADFSEIYMKIWNNNGTTNLIKYQPVLEKNKTEQIADLNASVGKIMERLDQLENRLTEMLNVPGKDQKVNLDEL